MVSLGRVRDESPTDWVEVVEPEKHKNKKLSRTSNRLKVVAWATTMIAFQLADREQPDDAQDDDDIEADVDVDDGGGWRANAICVF